MDTQPPRTTSSAATIVGATTRARHKAVALLAAVAMATSACGAVTEAAIDTRNAAEDAIELAQFCLAAARVAQAVQGNDLEAAAAAGQDLVDHAPDEILPSATFLLEAAKKAQAGDTSQLQSAQGRSALDEVARFTQDQCDPR